MALPALHRLKEAVAVGVGDAERVVDDVGVAVPRLPVERIGHERIGAHHAPDQRIVHPAVEVNEADIGQLLLAGEAADGLAGDAAGGIIRPGGEAPLAPSVIRVALDDGAGGALDALHRMWKRCAGNRIRVGADVRLRQQVADGS